VFAPGGLVSATLHTPKGPAKLNLPSPVPTLTQFRTLEQALNRGERIEIRGFGSFETRSYKGYKGRNPRSGSEVEVKPKRLPFFKAGKDLKDKVDAARSAAVARGVRKATPEPAPPETRPHESAAGTPALDHAAI